MSRVLITGSSGFLGKHLAQKLKDEGNYVVGISYKNSCGILDEEYYVNLVNNSYGEFDIAHFVKTRKFDKIYHCAGHASPQGNTLSVLQTNIMATANLLEGVTKEEFIFTSTAKVYGNSTNTDGIWEDDPPNPIDDYAISKLACEHLIRNHVSNHKIFRIGPIVGKGANHGIVKDILNSKGKVKLGGYYPGSSRTFTHVDDVVSALTLDLPVGIYNVSAQNSVNAYQLCLLLTGVAPQFSNEINRARDIYSLDINSTRIKEMGWDPKYATSEEALKNI